MPASRSALLLFWILCAGTLSARGGNADFIDPRIGTEGAGNTTIGPSLPFGMIKPGPDTGRNDRNSGWSPQGDINGFSQTHVSGTGGGCKYGNILLQPTTGPLQVEGIGSPRDAETAELGYYAVTLARYGVRAEITTGARAALYRFTYPAGREARLLFDAGHCLTGGGGEGQRLTASSAQVLSPTEVVGSSSVTGGWNMQTNSYTVYFYAVCDTPAIRSGTWKGAETHPGGTRESGDRAGTGAWLGFETASGSGPGPGSVVRVKVGISFVSVAQARANAEGLDGFDFEKTRAAAVAAWNRALAPVQISGGTEAQRKLFFTSLYHVFLMPADRTGENPLWTSGEPYYDDFYTIWDTFRSSSPLLTLLAPARQSEIVRSLIDIWRHDGFLPDGRSGNFNGRTQGGSDADILIADACAKGLPGIPWDDAYAAVVKDAEVAPADQFKEGRGGLDDWKKRGYCSMEGVDRSPDKTLEYAADDFGVATLAAALGKADAAALYLKRAAQWKNVWDADFSDGGFSGFARSRHRDGTWKKEFTALQGCSWNGDTFYEGNSWTYSLFVPQDVAGLIAQCGGPETFVKRLDAFFDVPGRCDVTDEPFFLTPYLYVWAGRPDKTAERVHEILSRRYAATPGGLPGNDDSGAMGSWYAFGAMGFFPNAGQDVYLLGTPLFDSTRIALGGGKTFRVEARNLSEKNIYIASATLDGRPLDAAWIRHRDIMAGGTLVLEMADRPGAWPTGAPPPSPLSEMAAAKGD